MTFRPITRVRALTDPHGAASQRHNLIAIGLLAMLVNCGPATGKQPRAATTDENADIPRESKPSTEQQPSTTSTWSEVQPLESASSGTTNRRQSHVIVSSDPNKHGDSIHFRFLVNNVPISGVFVVAGGKSTTFTIPVGTVHFTMDECEWEAQGFELAPDEDLPISCKLTKEGDCCEVAIPVEESAKESSKKSSRQAPNTRPSESQAEE
ncbi:MAG TPA: hypothetical protein VIV60_23800 [Polyangiaceae bacterium]